MLQNMLAQQSHALINIYKVIKLLNKYNKIKKIKRKIKLSDKKYSIEDKLTSYFLYYLI